MKTAIYAEKGTVQVVFTPECEFEKIAISNLTDKNASLKVFKGSFYECQGGFIRQGVGDESVMIRVDKP